jgi:hypothetical protein
MPEKTVFGVESGSNNIHFGGSVDSTYNESIGKNMPDICQYNFKSIQLRSGRYHPGPVEIFESTAVGMF